MAILPAAGCSANAPAAQAAHAQTAAIRRTPAGLQQAADQMVADGAPGVIILSRSGRQVSDVTAGLADKATGQPMQPQDKVHIASITKTFVAAVVLQLAAEGRLSLNDSVQQLLPGVIIGHGYDPAKITVRQLLQQTSGVQDYTSAPGFLTPQNLAKTWQPLQLVDIALSLGPPVHGWLYSNTNYIVLGMIIQKVTGQSPATEISRRILEPLGLRDTSFPLTGELFPEHYGLGIYSVQLSCGTAWGHDGGWPGGFKTIAYTSLDGSRQAVMVYNSYTMSVPPPAGTETAAFVRDQQKALEIAFCGTRA
jgi:D-alanyl-D-alanine carboxypeptidase